MFNVSSPRWHRLTTEIFPEPVGNHEVPKEPPDIIMNGVRNRYSND